MEDLTALAVAAGRGDREALDRFVGLAHPEVWRFCRHFVGEAQAADVTQDVFVKVIRSLPTFRARSSARTWLYTIARRSCADWIRVQQRRERLRGRLAAVADAPPPHGTATRLELDEALAGLAVDRREAFLLTQHVGLSYEEAAAVCGCPIGTIRSRVARARLDLLEVFAAQDDPVGDEASRDGARDLGNRAGTGSD